MLKHVILAIVGFTILANLGAQNNSDMKDILDKSAKKMNAYKSFSTEFSFITTQPQSKPVPEKGKLSMKGDKFHLTLHKSDIFCNGKDIYTYLSSSKEVNITKQVPTKADKGDFFLSNPRDIFKIYNKNFKLKLIKESQLDDKNCYEAELIPGETKTQYISVKLYIEKTSLLLMAIKLNMKDGTKYFLQLSNFTPNPELKDNEFNFDERKYPGVQINDMRF